MSVSAPVAAAVDLAIEALTHLGYFVDGIEAAATPDVEQSPLQVFARTQRVRMAIVEIRAALSELTNGD